MSSSKTVAPHIVLRAALLVGVLASAILLVDYTSGEPAFCGVSSGCATVRASSFSHVGNAPLPALGLVAELSLLILTLAARDAGASLMTAVVAGIGGVVALGLVAVQAFVLKAFCKWCITVDASAIVSAVAAALAYRDARKTPTEPPLGAGSSTRAAVAWFAGAALATVLPFVWGAHPVIAPLPKEIAARAVPGKLTIVSFTDFECPFCRRLSPALHAAIATAPDHIALVRLMAPLPMHPGAMPAAKAYVCTPREKQEEMAKLLYGLPVESLMDAGVAAAAQTVTLDATAFKACFDDAVTLQKVEADKALFDSLDLEGLPYTFVGRRSVVGANPGAIARFIEEELDGASLELPVAGLLAIMGVVIAGLCAWTARLSRGPAKASAR